MKKQDRIVYMDSMIPSIFFPAGKKKNGGTCDFSNAKCLKNCDSYLRTNKLEKYTLHFFEINSAKIVADRITQELDRNYGINFLQWFSWGDCPSRMTTKISKIMKNLSDEEIVQCGFTRNKKLWDKVLSVRNINLGLTIEEKKYNKIIIDPGKRYTIAGGLVGIPHYDIGEVGLVWGFEQRYRGGCSGSWYASPNGVTREANCIKCYEKKMGCFCKWYGDDVKVREINRFELMDL